MSPSTHQALRRKMRAIRSSSRYQRRIPRLRRFAMDDVEPAKTYSNQSNAALTADFGKPSDLAAQPAIEGEQTVNQIKSRVLANISHELRAPLTVIASSASILQTMGDRLDEQKKQKHFDRIQSKVHQMTQLLEDILLLSRTHQDPQFLKLESVDLIEFCANVVEELQLCTNQHAIVFSPHGICQSSMRPWVIQGNEFLLQRILSNLLSNSIKYSPNGGEIELKLIAKPNMLLFQVRDQGIGIPAHEQRYLFESFYRASNVNTIPGTGLGLAIVKKCVDLYGGYIGLKSQVGIGTTFEIEIPLIENQMRIVI